MLIRITTQSSKHTVVASTRDKTTLEGLDTLCNLYEHMLHLHGIMLAAMRVRLSAGRCHRTPPP